MIGIVIVTHGTLAEAFVKCIHQITGVPHDIASISVSPEDDMEQKRSEIVDAVSSADVGHGVIILTDLYGGTPANLALSALSLPSIEVIAGVNLPMLLQLVNLPRGTNLRTAVSMAQDAGRKQIQSPSSLLSGQRDEDPSWDDASISSI